jgi:N-acetylmuramoyl-L-alanine amidase
LPFKRLSRVVLWLICLVEFGSLLGVSSPQISRAAPNFASPGFQQLWEYSDKKVAGSPAPERGFTWGPVSLGVFQEKYLEGPGGQRTVQYYDKSRMELTHADQPVTNGLLTKELVSGKRQDGDNTFTQLAPSQLQVAGDSNLWGGNSNAPTYASFASLVTFMPGQHSAPDRTGQVIDQTVDKAGQVTKAPNPPAKLTYGLYAPTTGHNIPKVFAEYENLTGPVWDGSKYVVKKVFTDNPTVSVFGYPISEAYWTRVAVQGQERAVLVQLFERRVLTYTPSNPDPYKVEMGNIGQHYLQWRYGAAHVIVIDPGHGGPDSGTVHTGPGGKIDLLEKNITLAISLKTAELLRAEGYQVVLTRTTDASPNTPPQDLNGDGSVDELDDLEARINLANAARGEVFLSIHINSNGEPNSAGGIETWYCADRPFGAKSQLLARLVQQASVASLQEQTGYSPLDRSIRDDKLLDNDGTHFVVLGPVSPRHQVATEMPGVITEALFINNDAEAVLLTDPRTINALASGYAKALKAYFAAQN